MKVLAKIDLGPEKGMGYKSWLVVDSFGVNDCLLINKESDNPEIARCHPVIRADQYHADNLGVPVGTLICGVRWTEPYKGQEYIT